MTTLRSLLGAVLLLLLAGCATDPAPTSPVAPVTPVGVPAPTAPTREPAPVPVAVAKPATITGSEEPSTMFDNFTAYVTAVDGQPVAASRDNWSKPIPLPPGRHRLGVEFSRGMFTAKTDLLFIARSGSAYQLRFATDAQLFGKNSYCDFWIVDTLTGSTVIGPLRATVTKIAKPQ